MSIVVTGATGHLGRHVVESLLARGVPAEEITATGRAIERIGDLAQRGVRVLRVDLGDRAAVAAALAEATRVLLISGLDADRVAQHRNVIEAAVGAGVEQLAYTSAPHAMTTSMLLAADHRATEIALAESGLVTTILRNAWYVENYTAQLPTYLAHGMVGAAGQGRVSVALRREYGQAAAAVLTSEGHGGRVYELGGPAVSLPEIAAAISAVAGAPVSYTDVPVSTLRDILMGAGMPAPLAELFADVDRAISQGELVVDPRDLEHLLGPPVPPLADSVREALPA
jgi:NAD(P)H dehydrogenase (quinone)